MSQGPITGEYSALTREINRSIEESERKSTAPKHVSPKSRLLAGKPVVKFTKGSFKSFVYDKDEGHIVRVK